MSQLPEAFAVDTVFAGRYRVRGCLGRGAMGAVLAADELQTGRRVAIKCLLPGHCGDPMLVARFRREARATVRLRSEHVARVLDAGELTTAPGALPLPFIVMEHLEGEDLRAIFRRSGRFPAEQVADLLIQTCAGLAEAHALGIVHRDLKPANLFLSRAVDGRTVLKILDFGVAHFDSPSTSGDEQDMTNAGVAIGSYSYMAPEQLLDAGSVDARADIWSLGVVLYHLATGERPFGGETLREMALQIILGEYRPLEELGVSLPPGLVDVIRRCLRKERDQRFGSVVELARALSPFTYERARSPVEAQMFQRTARLPQSLGRALLGGTLPMENADPSE
ncbi:MAG: serine/threonine-protein kinase [Polyangiaceae bacterium]